MTASNVLLHGNEPIAHPPELRIGERLAPTLSQQRLCHLSQGAGHRRRLRNPASRRGPARRPCAWAGARRQARPQRPQPPHRQAPPAQPLRPPPMPGAPARVQGPWRRRARQRRQPPGAAPERGRLRHHRACAAGHPGATATDPVAACAAGDAADATFATLAPGAGATMPQALTVGGGRLALRGPTRRRPPRQGATAPPPCAGHPKG